MKIFEMIADGGIPAFIIVAMGLFALAIIVERVKVLYKDYGINSESFMKHIRGMVMKDQIEDAITFCANQGIKLKYSAKALSDEILAPQKYIGPPQKSGVLPAPSFFRKYLGYNPLPQTSRGS